MNVFKTFKKPGLKKTSKTILSQFYARTLNKMATILSSFQKDRELENTEVHRKWLKTVKQD